VGGRAVEVMSARFTWPEVVMLAVFWLALWLGLYLLSRRPRSSPVVLAGLAYLAMASYVLTTTVLAAPERVPWDMFWGDWLGGFAPFAPVLLLHADLSLTGIRLPRQRAVLAVLYVAAAVVYVIDFSPTLLYHYHPAVAGATTSLNGTSTIGPLYPFMVVQTTGTLALAAAVVWRARLRASGHGGRKPVALDLIGLGTTIMLISVAALFVNAYANSPGTEFLLQPLLVAGAVVTAVPLVSYSGLLRGQLLRTDLLASMLGSAVLLVVFTVLVLLAGASLRVLLGVGWFVIAVFLFRDDLWSLVDRVFYGAGSRAGRSGLRTVAAYAGETRLLDVRALSESQSADVLDYFSSIDRAEIAAAQLDVRSDPRLELLGREEYADVREALGLQPGWTSNDAIHRMKVRARVLTVLEPRERQALGLKYLGYADKEMARLMGVRPGVPRSYLSAGKRKLGLPAGAPLMLFVHFAGLVDGDAIGLIGASSDPARSGLATADSSNRLHRAVDRPDDA
jgi:hypothetical protein